MIKDKKVNARITKGKINNFLESKWLIWIIVIIGITARLHQYLLNHTLWLDEAFIAINVIKSNFKELLLPLKYYSQSAPVLFLESTKLITKIYNNSEFAFRLLPLLAGIGSVIVAYFLGKKFLNKKALIVFLTLIAFSRYGIYYSAELKQYSIEFLATILILIVVINAYNSNYNLRSSLIALTAGAILIFCSYSSIFIILGVSAALIIGIFLKKKEIKNKNILFLVLTIICWLIAFLVNYLFFIKGSPTSAYNTYWAGLSAFPPNLPKSIADFLWFPKTFLNLIKDPLGLAFHISNINKIPYFIIVIQYFVVIIFFITGTISLIKSKSWFKLSLIYFPVFVLFIASLSGFYPLYGRLELFIVPLGYLLIVEGVYFSTKMSNKTWKILGFILLAILFAFPIFFEAYNIINPKVRHETKPAIEYVIKNSKSGDKVLIYPSEEPVFLYYTNYYFSESGNFIKLEKNYSKENEQYYEDIFASLKNNRIWIVFPFGTSEEKDVLKVISGFQIKSDEFKSTASIYLFNPN
ncbi:MAG: glycosyltransferase family 39 protein [Actinobacteria bacterium]|nr:glycosyltransferase family 39 protein [Actinomycetota bacterium]